MTTTMTLGQQGEDYAASYYLERGARILDRNVRYRVGEIDLIAEEPGGTVVFVEVKTRSGRGFGAAEAVDRRKLLCLRRAASAWLRSRPWTPVRFDVLVLTVAEHRCGIPVFETEHYEGVERGAC
ncbi:YraN family protein [Corynebacterium lowii]|nr:YraN family protein [Corynebacterium lowii]MDP9851322.1 putative endonuclease [Corynebacterium lowii]